MDFSGISDQIKKKARKVKLVITDCDGVLTDNGVFYSESGESMKRFSIRDGMGVERLRNIANVESSIMTGENSGSVRKRAEKLKIKYLYQGIKDKVAELQNVLQDTGLEPEQIAYIGDDCNDVEIIKQVGLSATPNDGMIFTKEIVDYICHEKGGFGAFREFAELIIFIKQEST